MTDGPEARKLLGIDLGPLGVSGTHQYLLKHRHVFGAATYSVGNLGREADERFGFLWLVHCFFVGGESPELNGK